MPRLKPNPLCYIHCFRHAQESSKISANTSYRSDVQHASQREQKSFYPFQYSRPARPMSARSFSARSFSASLLTLSNNCLYTGYHTTCFTYFASAWKLARSHFHTHIELLATHFQESRRKFFVVLTTEFVRFHYNTVRVAKAVRTGSLALASRSASRATSSVTPSISYRMVPGLTWATQYSTFPFSSSQSWFVRAGVSVCRSPSYAALGRK